MLYSRLTERRKMKSDHRWWAILAPMPTLEPTGIITTSHNAARVLDRAYRVGVLSLRPGEQQIVEYVRHLDLGWTEIVSWPVIVEGVSQGDHWTAVTHSATPLLHRLSTLFALAWGEPWQVRVAPKDPANLPPVVPEPSPPREWFNGYNPQIGMRALESLPAWIPPAWERISQGEIDTAVIAALSCWHQGLLLTPQHPSFAFVAFIAAIEALGPATAKTRSARFWSAVATVAEAAEVDRLKQQNLYGLRSATAHSGGLHGLETMFGAHLFLPMDPEDSVERFMFETLRTTARIGRQLLLRIFISSESTRRPLFNVPKALG
jgi:hypothetical protein